MTVVQSLQPLEMLQTVPQQDSLNSCFSEITGRGHIDAAYCPRQCAVAQYRAPDQTCKSPVVPQKWSPDSSHQIQAAPRLTKALLEAYDRHQQVHSSVSVSHRDSGSFRAGLETYSASTGLITKPALATHILGPELIIVTGHVFPTK